MNFKKTERLWNNLQNETRLIKKYKLIVKEIKKLDLLSV